VDHLPDGILASGHQPGGRRHTGVPLTDAMMIVARRTQIDLFVDTHQICGPSHTRR